MAFWNRKVDRSYSHVPGPARSIGDPALTPEYFGWGQANASGMSVTESSVLGLTAVYRCVSLISGTVAGLPLKSYSDSGEVRAEVKSVFDDPGGDLFTPYEFVQLCMVHLLLHGNAFLLHVYTEGGSLAALYPLHPSLVTAKWNEEAQVKEFHVAYNGYTEVYLAEDMTHLMGVSTDGLQGLSPIRALRDSLGSSLAADNAASTMFAQGLSVGGVITPAETMSEDDAKAAAAALRSKLTGNANRNSLAFVNASMKIDRWTLSNEDAQFIESRQMQVSEVARIFGVPVQLLAQDGASSWGSGIQELIIAWVKFTLRNWTAPIEQKFSALLSNPRFVEFEYKALLQGSPKEEVELLLAQVAGGLLTMDEARAVMNLPPLPAAEKAAQTADATGDSGQSPADNQSEGGQ